MSANQIMFFDSVAEQRTRQIHRDLKSLGWHDWSLWALALVVILALTALATVLSPISESDDPVFQLTMGQSIRGLLGLVLIFSVYTFYQQIQLKKTRARLARQVEIATKEQERAEQALASVTPDKLTGLHDERFAQLRLATEIGRSRRNGTPLTILMLGLSDFAQIIDRYDRATGDLALRTLAQRVSGAIRGCDLAVLAGECDIMVILPECPLDRVQWVVNRLFPMKILAESKVIPVAFTTSSTGYNPDETPEEFSRRAHQEFEAKKAVRANQPHPVA